MNAEQINKIQKYQGDIIEESWKPGPLKATKNYVDLFYFWEFRESVRACGLEHLRPMTSKKILSRNFIFMHERLAAYYYTAYSRLASMHQCLIDIENHLTQNRNLSHFFIQHAFESFYFFLGSVLDNMGAVGNIIFGFDHKEDSFSKFYKKIIKIEELKFSSNDLELLENIRNMQENYRAQISHRGRLGTLITSKLNVSIPLVQSEFKKSGSAKKAYSWRKELREMAEGRLRKKPMPQLCSEHLLKIEKSVNLIFKICTENLTNYLERNNARITNKPKEFDIELKKIPSEANWILYRCNGDNQNYLNHWFHPLSDKKFPKKCINQYCDSSDIQPMYFLKD